MKLIQLETRFTEAFVVLLALKWNSSSSKLKTVFLYCVLYLTPYRDVSTNFDVLYIYPSTVVIHRSLKSVASRTPVFNKW